MTLENQVTSLELSEKLKELGVKQESLFWYQNELLSYCPEFCNWGIDSYGMNIAYNQAIAAFTVAELGEMLPLMIEDYGNENIDLYLNIQKLRDGSWEIEYRSYQITYISKSESTEANARAAMLIYLIENKPI
jgi:hypothetical protein